MPKERPSPFDRMRAAASGRIATNAGLLETTPRRGEHPPSRREALEPLSALPGGVAGGLEKHVKKVAPPPTNGGERLARGLTRRHLKGVGWVGDVAEMATAKDKKRAAAGIAGSRAASLAAGLIPPQLVTVPVAAVLGSWAGKEVYDRAPEYMERVRMLGPNLKDQIGRELTRYVPYDLPDRIMRR